MTDALAETQSSEVRATEVSSGDRTEDPPAPKKAKVESDQDAPEVEITDATRKLLVEFAQDLKDQPTLTRRLHSKMALLMDRIQRTCKTCKELYTLSDFVGEFGRLQPSCYTCRDSKNYPTPEEYFRTQSF